MAIGNSPPFCFPCVHYLLSRSSKSKKPDQKNTSSFVHGVLFERMQKLFKSINENIFLFAFFFSAKIKNYKLKNAYIYIFIRLCFQTFVNQFLFLFLCCVKGKKKDWSRTRWWNALGNWSFCVGGTHSAVNQRCIVFGAVSRCIAAKLFDARERI